MATLAHTVERCLRRHGLAADARIAVACSGGADSIALAHLVAGLVGGEAPLLLHVDHRLRPTSGADAEAVRALAARLGLGFHLEVAEIERRASLEDAARRARHAAFDRAARARGLSVILLAHTADDQAETVLHRLVRGTGIRGLAGMAERRGLLLRPLLGRRRAELVEHGARHGLVPVDDAMNRDPRFARVRLRLDLVPRLERENPRAVEALVRLAAQAAEVDAATEWAARRLLADNPALPAEAVAAAPTAVARRALALAAEDAGLGPLSSRHLTSLHRLASTPDGFHLDLPGGAVAGEYGRLRWSPRALPAGEPPPLALAAGRPVRRWRPGDRMRPARLRGRSRKLSDLYADLRIPRAERARARVVLDESGAIAWAEHVGPAFDAAADLALTGGGSVASNKN